MAIDNYFAPTYKIYVKGKLLSSTRLRCVESVEIKETVEGADTCSIKISDPNFLFIDDNIFKEKNSLKVVMGISSCSVTQTFEGYISAVDVEFPESGIPSLTITGMDKTHLMNRKKKSRTFTKKTRAQIVAKIAKSYGFKCVVEKNYKFKTVSSISQSSQTDADFLQKLAGDELYPFTCRLVGNTIYYVKKGKLGTPVMTLHYLDYPHEIQSFSPKVNTETRQEETQTKTVTNSKKTTTGSSSSTTSKSSSTSSSKTSKKKDTKSSSTPKNNNNGKKDISTWDSTHHKWV